MAKINYLELVADGLKAYCKHWDHDYIERLKENNSVHNFYKVFCKITNTYYINTGSEIYDFSDNVDHYNVTFNKKEDIASIKRCGKDFDKRDADATIDVGELIKALVR